MNLNNILPNNLSVTYGGTDLLSYAKYNQYVFCSKNGINNIDYVFLQKSITTIKKALSAIKKQKTPIHILFCSKNENYAKLLQKAAKSLHTSCVVGRWTGGVLTNKKATNKYLAIDLAFIPDVEKNKELLEELNILNIPIIGITGTTVSCPVSYPIIWNAISPEIICLTLQIFCTLATKTKAKNIINE